jgi:hypothetical protein
VKRREHAIGWRKENAKQSDSESGGMRKKRPHNSEEHELQKQGPKRNIKNERFLCSKAPTGKGTRVEGNARKGQSNK